MTSLSLFAADLHGSKGQYERLIGLAQEHGAARVILGGDLFPKDGGSWTPDNKIRTVEAQRKFIEEFFLEYLNRLSESADVYFIFGNDDFRANLDLFENLRKNVKLLNSSFTQLSKNKWIYGYPYVGLTPFLLKDWEKWDVTGVKPKKTFVSKGYRSKGNKYIEVDFRAGQLSKESIENDLNNLPDELDVENTVFLFHEAPYGSALDMTGESNQWESNDQVHMGSVAVKQFIAEKQPYLTLHGHIHETVEVSGKFCEKNGRTVSATCGNDYASGRGFALLFDLEDLSVIKRIGV